MKEEPKEQKALFLFQNQWDELEAIFKLPIEEREQAVFNLYMKRQIECLGTTDKSVPELGIELIKKGIKVKTYVAPPNKSK